MGCENQKVMGQNCFQGNQSQKRGDMKDRDGPWPEGAWFRQAGFHPSPVVHKGEHEQSLLDEPFPLWVFTLQVPVVVIGDNDAILLVGHLHNVAVIVANDSLAADLAGRGVHQHSLPLQLFQHVLL